MTYLSRLNSARPRGACSASIASLIRAQTCQPSAPARSSIRPAEPRGLAGRVSDANHVSLRALEQGDIDMPHILFVHEHPGRGIASIPLGQVKGALGLTLVRGQRVERYDLWGRPANIRAVAPDGEPVINLEIGGREDYPVARWPHAVAVTVSDMLFWLEDSRLAPSSRRKVRRGTLARRSTVLRRRLRSPRLIASASVRARLGAAPSLPPRVTVQGDRPRRAWGRALTAHSRCEHSCCSRMARSVGGLGWRPREPIEDGEPCKGCR